MIPRRRQPTHPGKILLRDFLEPRKLTQMELARRMGVSIQRVNALINEKRDVSAETAILLSRVLKTSAEFWMNLQNAHDLYEARQHLATPTVNTMSKKKREADFPAGKLTRVKDVLPPPDQLVMPAEAPIK